MLASTAAKLLASLELDTKPFEAGARRAGAAIGGMESRFSRIGSIAQRGLGNAAANIKRLGLVAAGFIGANVVQGIRSLQDLERVTNATKGVIESTGGAAGVTAEEIRSMAQALEDLTTADDKAIQEGQNMLLTFTSIGRDVFPRATEAVTDLAIAMADGNVENADFSRTAIQVGKALNDPVRGITALRRVGVQFNDQQAKRIEQLVEEGKLQEAQVLILQELEKEFGKAGEAAGQGFGADMRRAQDAIEDAQQALATGFLPLIRRASNFLTTELAKPEVLARIREFGDGLAKGFDQALDFAKQIPWSTIGDALRIGGQGAKAVLDAFSAMPDWVKTAVITGWGLNKLTGGAVSGIIGELGKGLIKGVLGMNAGVVNINAGIVKGGGLPVPGGSVPTPAGGVGVGTIVTATLAIPAAITIANAIREAAGITPEESADRQSLGQFGPRSASNVQPVKVTNVKELNSSGSPDERDERRLAVIAKNTEDLKYVQELRNLDRIAENTEDQPSEVTKKQQKSFDVLRDKGEATKIAIGAQGQRTQQRIDASRAAITAAQNTARQALVVAQVNAASRIVSAIQALDLSVVVNSNVSVSGNGYTSNGTVNYNNTTKQKDLEKFT